MPKHKRLIIICLLTLILVPAGIPTVGAIGPDATVWIEPAESVAELNETFTVQVMIEGANDLGAFQFELTYDASILQVQEAALGDFLGSTGRSAVPVGPNVDNAKGRVTLGAISFGDATGPSGKGVLATITCLAQGEGSTLLQLLDVEVLGTEAGAQSVTVQNGQVEVRGVAAPTPVPTATPTSPATPKLTNTPEATDTPTPAATAQPSPTTMATRPAVKTPPKAPPPSPIPSVTGPAVETPTKAPPSSPTPSPTIASTETKPAEATIPSTVLTVETTQTPVLATTVPTIVAPSPSPSPPSPISASPPSLRPSPTQPATVASPVAKDFPSWVPLGGLLAALGLAILAALILRCRPEG